MGNLAGFIEEEDEDMQIEEWWAQTFEGRGSVTLDQMPDNSIQVIRKLKTEEVLELVRSEDTRSVRGLIAHMEMRRREQWTARAALVVSIIALVVAALTRLQLHCAT